MKCPFCGFSESKVVDSRPADEGVKIRRRRECLECEKRFTTYELIESTPLMVVKRDDSRQLFDRAKLLKSLIIACGKRPVNYEKLEEVVDYIEYSLINNFEKEVTSEKIGEMVLYKLKDIDLVAYVRFASVYREFSNIDEFMVELNILQNLPK